LIEEERGTDLNIALLEPCVASGVATNVILAGEPRLVRKLHTGYGPHACLRGRPLFSLKFRGPTCPAP